MNTEKPNDIQTIPYKIIEVSSEDPEFTSAELEQIESKGWQTAPGVFFPQHIIIGPVEEQERGCFSDLRKIQILSHENKMPTKIEVFVRYLENHSVEENDFDPVLTTYERLGFIFFDSNSKTNYRSRELKSIELNNKAFIRSLKLVIHGCHGNATDNPYSQVGIISIRLFSFIEDEVADMDKLGDTKYTKSNELVPYLDYENDIISSETEVKNQATQYSMSLHGPTLDETEPKKCSIQSRIEWLNELKIQKANDEDFDGAAKIKSILTSLISVMTTYNEFHEAMKKAAENEDYAEAAQWKKKRDTLNQQLESTLLKAEKEATSSKIHFDFNESSINSNIHDLSISTIRRNEEDDVSSIGMTMTAKSIPFDDRPIKPRHDPVLDIHGLNRNEAYSSSSIVEIRNNQTEIFEEGHHPLEGVQDYSSLPQPEEYLPSTEAISKTPNSWSLHVSSDSILKIESVLGPYRTRCFLSKNWALREAAIIKLSLMLDGLVSSLKTLHDNYLGWWDSFSRSVFIIVEKCLEDKVVQVFLSGCILFDDFIHEIEKLNLNTKEVQSLLSNALILLINKIGDSNTKVEEATETLLMSLALSDIIGPSHMVSQVLKFSETEMKASKAICRRCFFLNDMLKEFGILDQSSVEKIVEFLEKSAINHKDAETRDAAKDLIVQLHLLDETSTSSIVSGFSERQTKDFNVAYTKAAALMRDDPKALASFPSNQNSNDDHRKLPNLVTGDTFIRSPGRRGRGRGRGNFMQKRELIMY